MTARYSLTTLDAYLAALVDQALGATLVAHERLEILRHALKLGRYLAVLAWRSPLQAALDRGDAPATFEELLGYVEPRRLRWRKVVRVSQRLATAGRQRSNRSTERLFPPAEVARELGFELATITHWCTQGLLRATPGADGVMQIPASALYAYRTEQARWKRLQTVTMAAADGAPAPEEAAIFAEIALRRRA